jgi:hypothetical protein
VSGKEQTKPKSNPTSVTSLPTKTLFIDQKTKFWSTANRFRGNKNIENKPNGKQAIFAGFPGSIGERGDRNCIAVGRGYDSVVRTTLSCCKGRDDGSFCANQSTDRARFADCVKCLPACTGGAIAAVGV